MNTETRYVLALDQGTFSSRCILFDDRGQMIDSAQQSIDLNRISQRKIEQDGQQIINSVQQTLSQVLERHVDKHQKITSAGLATQRSSIVAWRPSNGEILSPVLSWQDTRAFQQLDSYQSQSNMIQAKTGLRLTAHYGVTKMRWLLEHEQRVATAVAEHDCVITPLASLILYHLCEEQRVLIDGANAARTLLFNLVEQDWDQQLLELFDIDPIVLPRVLPSCHDYGTIKKCGIKIQCVNGDQTAALYAKGHTYESCLYVNLGTGAFVLNPVKPELLQSQTFQESQLLAGIARSFDDQNEFYIEGTVNGASAALDWLREYDKQNDIDQFLGNALTSAEHDVLFINSVGGLGSPLWRHDIEPRFINDDGDPAIRVKAVLESIVFLITLNIEAILRVRSGIRKIEISGGLSNNDYIGQCLADLVSLTVDKNESSEATAQGIAWLALDDHSRWMSRIPGKSYDAKKNNGLHQRYRQFKAYLV